MSRRAGLLSRVAGAVGLLVLYWFSTCCFSKASADESPEDALKQKGLRRFNATFVHHDELEVSKLSREATQRKRAMYTAKKQLSAAEKKGQEFDLLAGQLRQQRSDLRKRLAGARSAHENNQYVAAIEEFDEKIPKIEEQGLNGKEVKAALAAENKARESYIETVINLRKAYDKGAEEYEALKADQSVTDAIEQYNAKAEKKAQLGPSVAFTRQAAAIKHIEESIFSETIPLRVGEDHLCYVNVVFGGKTVIEAAVDTAASSILLPFDVAAKVGVPVQQYDPKVEIQLADGHVIEATKKILPKVRVGKFEAENVECVVLPADAKNADPILGQSFLKQFSYKVDPAAATLIMTRVD